ncbi:DUF4893 domain-containing protein [Devosia chinhatensis]|uniref:DUF4893 domain-containing protein n=1 Tax=Devosia aurantiaca TaxID=2714858 RepID=A0A6M1SHN9_9HYPH|nr:DUF4893 domain-containing protein [Devosia aurantiaca]NGP16708.1 DUF4893 domain-containing protein [Devosia aurantiaca]
MPLYASRLPTLAAAAFLSLPVLAPTACTVPDGVDLSTVDAERMENYETSRVRGLAEAMLGTFEKERAAVAAVFSPDTEEFGAIPDGTYQCRTLKLGGLLPLTVYGYFDCDVSGDGSRIEKVSGSQRFTGTLTPGMAVSSTRAPSTTTTIRRALMAMIPNSTRSVVWSNWLVKRSTGSNCPTRSTNPLSTSSNCAALARRLPKALLRDAGDFFEMARWLILPV